MSHNCVKVPDLSCRFGVMLRCGSTRLIFSGLHSTCPSQLPKPKERPICAPDIKAGNQHLVFLPAGCKSGFFNSGTLQNAHCQTTYQSSTFPNINFFQHVQQARIQGLKGNKPQRDRNATMLNSWSKTSVPLLAKNDSSLLSLHNDKAVHMWEKVLIPERLNSTTTGYCKAAKGIQETTVAKLSAGSSSGTDDSKDILALVKGSRLPENGVCKFRGTDKDPSPSSDEGKGKPPPNNKATPLQLSQVLCTLRDELPWFFFGGHKFDIYNKRVVFINGLMSNFRTRGLWFYRAQINLMRWAALLCYSQVTLNIISISKSDQESVIKVRWQVEGMARYKAYAKWLTVNVFPERKSYIDGISTLEVGPEGNVVIHNMEKVMRMRDQQLDPKFVVNAASFVSIQKGSPLALGMFGLLSRTKVAPDEDVLPPLWETPTLMD